NDDEGSISSTRFDIIFKVDEEQMITSENMKDDLILYPNPTKENSFNLLAKDYANRPLRIQVINMLGQSLINQEADVQSDGILEVALPQNTPVGAYHVTVWFGNKKILTKKLIKR